MTRQEIMEIAGDLMKRSNGAYVSTNSEKPFPYIRMMFNLRNVSIFPMYEKFFSDKGLTLYFSTNTSSFKNTQLHTNPYCSVYYSVSDEFIGLMFAGKAEVIQDRTVKEALWLEGGERYYPTGIDDPDYTILRIVPEYIRGWYKGQPIELKLDGEA